MDDLVWIACIIICILQYLKITVIFNALVTLESETCLAFLLVIDEIVSYDVDWLLIVTYCCFNIGVQCNR